MGRSKLQNERFCVICGSHTTYFTKSGYAQWRRVHGHYMCNRCYFREIFNPCSLKFKEKRLTLPTVARTHIPAGVEIRLEMNTLTLKVYLQGQKEL